MGHSQAVEYAVIGMFFIFMLVTGFVFRRFVKDSSDYFRGGCRGTWWLVGSSVFMISFTAWTFTAAAGVAFSAGITVSVIFFANTFGYIVNALVTAPIFRQMRATTFPEVIRERFDTATQQFYVWMGVVPGILMTGLVLLSTAVFTAAVFGFNLHGLIIVIGVVVLIYSTVGGSWSAMATDFLQTLILMPLALLITILSLNVIGGFSGIFSEIKNQNLEKMLSFVAETPEFKHTGGWIAAMFLFVFLSYNSLGSSTKYFACKDGREARKAAALAAILMLLGSLLWFIPPIVARLKFAAIVNAQNVPKPAETAYAIISIHLLPRGLSGLIVVAMFSATMSSICAQLNSFAAIITQDVYKPFVRPGGTSRELLVVGQIASAIMGVLIIAAALALSKTKGKGLFEYMMLFGSLFSTPMIIPMFLTLFVRKSPVRAAIISICSALVFSYMGWRYKWSYERSVFTIVSAGVIAFFFAILIEKAQLWPAFAGIYACAIFSVLGRLIGLSYEPDIFTFLSAGTLAFILSLPVARSRVMSALAALTAALLFPILGWRFGWRGEPIFLQALSSGAIAICLTLILRPLWRHDVKEYEARVAGFYKKMHTKVDFEKEVGRATDVSQLRILGYVAICMGVFIALLVILPNPLRGRLQIFFLAAADIFFGLVMLSVANIREKKRRALENVRPA